MKDETPNANLDPFAIVQGHNGEKQTFTLVRSDLVKDDIRGRQVRRFIGTDQFGNEYVVFRAVLQDGEVYDVAPNLDNDPLKAGWLNRPSLLDKFGGTSESLLDRFKEAAFRAFDDKVKEIQVERAIAEAFGTNAVGHLVIPTNLEIN